MGDDNRVTKPLITNDQRLCDVDAYALEIGKFTRELGTQVRYCFQTTSTTMERRTICWQTLLGLPVFSQRLESASLLDSKRQEARTYSICRFVWRSQQEMRFMVSQLQILSHIPALDPDHSKMLEIDENEVDKLTGRPRVVSVWTASLKANLLNGHDVIRLVKSFSTNIRTP